MTPPGNTAGDPYLPPQSTLDADDGVGRHCFSPAVARSLIASRRTMLIGGRCGILAGLVAVSQTVANMLILIATGRENPAVMIVFVTLIGVGVFVATMLPWGPLKQCLAAIGRLEASGHDRDVEAAMHQHGRFWTRLGIGLLVSIGTGFALPLALAPFMTGPK